jgi:hypothetical protein
MTESFIVQAQEIVGLHKTFHYIFKYDKRRLQDYD